MPKCVTGFRSDIAHLKPVKYDMAEWKYLKSVEATLSEWHTAEDAAAYDGLLKGNIKKPQRRRKDAR